MFRWQNSYNSWSVEIFNAVVLTQDNSAGRKYIIHKLYKIKQAYVCTEIYFLLIVLM